MTKGEFIEKFAEKTGINKAEAGRAVDATIAAITGALVKGDKVPLVGFGTFGVSRRAARTGRNPQTGAAVKIPARNAVTFKAGSQLKEAVNK